MWTRYDRAGVPGAPLSSRAFVENLKAYAKQAGLSHIHLHETRHTYARYVLTGPESLSHIAQVGTIGEVLGRSLRYEEMSPDEALRELPFPATAVTMLLDAWAAAIGQPALVTSTIAEVTGRLARTFREWVRNHAGEFHA